MTFSVDTMRLTQSSLLVTFSGDIPKGTPPAGSLTAFGRVTYAQFVIFLTIYTTIRDIPHNLNSRRAVRIQNSLKLELPYEGSRR